MKKDKMPVKKAEAMARKFRKEADRTRRQYVMSQKKALENRDDKIYQADAERDAALWYYHKERATVAEGAVEILVLQTPLIEL